MTSEPDKLLSTTEAAKLLGVTRQRVLELIQQQRLTAQKVGHSYVISAAAVETLTLNRVGRPRKSKPE